MKNGAYSIDLQNTSFHNIFGRCPFSQSTFTVLTPNQYQMKKIYIVFLLGISLATYAQETTTQIPTVNAEIEGFKLYPNPATADVVYLTTEQNDSKEVRIFDVFGELVLTDRISSKALDISRLSPGIYMVQVVENKRSIHRKLVVK